MGKLQSFLVDWRFSLSLSPPLRHAAMSLKEHTENVLTFSPVRANGALNHCSNVLHDLKMLGSKKFINAHNSGNLFYKNDVK